MASSGLQSTLVRTPRRTAPEGKGPGWIMVKYLEVPARLNKCKQAPYYTVLQHALWSPRRPGTEAFPGLL